MNFYDIIILPLHRIVVVRDKKNKLEKGVFYGRN